MLKKNKEINIVSNNPFICYDEDLKTWTFYDETAANILYEGKDYEEGKHIVDEYCKNVLK